VYDDRDGSPTRGAVVDIETGQGSYSLITIPPGTWSGFAAMGAGSALVANCATLPYDANEIDRRAADDPAIPYVWYGSAARLRVADRTSRPGDRRARLPRVSPDAGAGGGRSREIGRASCRERAERLGRARGR